MTLGDQERLVGDILRASYGAVTVEEFAKQGLPLLDSLLNTSTSLLYRFTEDHGIMTIAGTMAEANSSYSEMYFGSDPMQKAIQRQNRWILHSRRCQEWKEFLKLPVYNEHARLYGIDHYIHLKLTETKPHQPGMVGMVLARDAHQPDFNETDDLVLARLLPAMEALTQRSARLEQKLRQHSILSTLSESNPQPKLALSTHGKVLWASESAERLLSLNHRTKKELPEILVKTACQLGQLIENKTVSVAPESSFWITQEASEPIHVELHVQRDCAGISFIVAEFDSPEIIPKLDEVAAKVRLTSAEKQVLKLISCGLSDRKISECLFVSMHTIRTHVSHILAKLDVNSRLQAALLAHGIRKDRDSL